MKSIILKLFLSTFCVFAICSCSDESRMKDSERPNVSTKEEANTDSQSGSVSSGISSKKVWTAEEIAKFRFFLLDEKEIQNVYQFGLNGELDLNGNSSDDLSVLLFDKQGNLVQETKVDSKGKFNFSKLNPSAYSLALSDPNLNLNANIQLVDGDNVRFLTNKDGKAKTHTAIKEKKAFPLNDAKVWTPEEIAKFRFYMLEKSKTDNYSSFSLNGHLDNTNAQGDDLSVLLFDSKGKQVQKAKVDENGNFVFKKLKPSEYSMVLSKPDLAVNASVQVVDAEDAKIVVNNKNQAHNNLTEKSKSVKVGDRLAEMEIVERLLEKVHKDPDHKGPYDVSGKLSNTSQTPVSNTPVYLVNDKGEVVDKKISDKDGNFVFTKLENGNYSVIQEKVNPAINAKIAYNYQDESNLVTPFALNQVLTQKQIDEMPNALVEKSSFDGAEADLKGKVFRNSALKNRKEESLWLVDENGKLVKSTNADKDGIFVFGHTLAQQYQVVMEGTTPEQATLDIINPEQSYQKEFLTKTDTNLVTLLSKPLQLKDMKDHATNASINLTESHQTASNKEAFRLYQLAVHKVKRDDFEGAKKDLEKALELRPDYVDAYILHGKVCELTKKYDHALDAYNKVLDFRPNHLTALYRRAYIENEKGQYERAIEDFTKVIKIYPEFTYPYFYRGVAENQLNQQQLAIDDYQRMLNIDSTAKEAYFNKGSSYFQLQKYDEAIYNYNRSLRLDTLNPDVYFNRGQVYQFRGEYSKALSDFNKAIEYGPIRNAYFEIGNTYSLMKDESSARKYINEGVARFANDAESYSQRGIYEYNHGKYDAALDDFNTAIYINKEVGEYYFKRGIVHAAMNKVEDACNDFVKAKSLNYNDPEEEYYWKTHCKHIKK